MTSAADASHSQHGSTRPRIRIVPAEPEHAEALAELQRLVFPNLAAADLMTAAHFRQHQLVFAAGEFVALAADAPDGTPLGYEKVVGLGSGFLTDFDLDDGAHTFSEMIAGGTYAGHQPDGDWYYGADISVHPDYRRLGIGKLLYEARKSLVRQSGRRGIVAGGQLPGYPEHKARLTVADYVAAVVAGELRDPTLSFQLDNGFEVVGLIEGYMEDEYTDDWATLIVWRNPDYVDPAPPASAAKLP
ncbi:MAG TPA: GNAT family N-acetyltransferase [Trueperaceae bacterium]|nr:GNAT family N-acetyltransferase [Trueperaceae bacterium]